MPDFVTDNLTLPNTKTDLSPLPGGADTTKHVTAAEWNALCNAAISLRTALGSVGGGGLTFRGVVAVTTACLPNSAYLVAAGSVNLQMNLPESAVAGDVIEITPEGFGTTFIVSAAGGFIRGIGGDQDSVFTDGWTSVTLRRTGTSEGMEPLWAVIATVGGLTITPPA